MIALFAALIGPYFIDWTNYRADFEREASNLLGRKVEVHGHADARLLPFPSLTFTDIRVGKPNNGEGATSLSFHTAQIEEFSVDAELAPFLQGRVLIFDMRIKNPHIFVGINKSGELDIVKGARRSIKSLLPAAQYTLEKVSITGGEIVINDKQNERQHRLTQIDAELSAVSIKGPWKIVGSGSVNGHKSAFQVLTGKFGNKKPVRLRTRLLPDDKAVSIELDGHAKIVEGKPSYEGSFTVQALNVLPENFVNVESKNNAEIRSTGSFALNNERLQIDTYRLEIGNSDDPYVVTGEATLDTGKNPEFLLIADGQQINTNQLPSSEARANGKSTNDKSKKNDDRPTNFTERLEDIRKLVQLVPIPELPGRISVILPAIIFDKTVIRQVSIDLRPAANGWKIDRLNATLPGRTKFEVAGDLNVGNEYEFNGQVLVASQQPSGLATWLGNNVNPAIRRLKNAGFGARIQINEQLLRLEKLELVVDNAVLLGRFERIVTAKNKVKMSVELAGDKLDLEAIKALQSMVFGKKSKIENDFLLRLNLDELKTSQLVAKGVDALIIYSGSKLDIQRLNIENVAGATLKMKGAVSLSSKESANNHGENIGVISGSVKASSLRPFFTFLSAASQKYVLFDDIAQNAAAYSGTHMDFDVGVKKIEESAFEVSLKGVGVSNESRFDVAATGVYPFSALLERPMRFEINAENEKRHLLLAQMGQSVLPIDDGEAMRVAFSLKGIPTEDANYLLDVRSNNDALLASGSISLPERGPYFRARDKRITGGGAFSLVADDLEPYLLLAGKSLPQFGNGLKTKIKTAFDIGSNFYVLNDLEVAVNDNEFQGQLNFDRNALGDKITGNIDASTLSFSWLSEALWGPEGQINVKEGWRTGEFSPPLFENVDMNIQFKSKEAITAGGSLMENSKADMRFSNGVLSLDNFSSDWLNGKINGNISLSNGNGTGFLSGQMSLKDVDLASVVWKKVSTNSDDGSSSLPVATGKFSMSTSFEGSGKSIRSLVSSLNGSGVATFNDLTIEHLNTKLFSNVIEAANVEGFEISNVSVGEIVSRFLDEAKLTHPKTVIAYSLAGGVLRANNIYIENEDVRINGNTKIDLSRRNISSNFQVTFDPGLEVISGTEPSVSLSYKGILDGPQKELDVGLFSSYLSQRAFENERRRVELLQAAILEKQRLRREIGLIKYQRGIQKQTQKNLEWLKREDARQQSIEFYKGRAEREVIEIEEAPALDGVNSAPKTQRKKIKKKTSKVQRTPKPLIQLNDLERILGQ